MTTIKSSKNIVKRAGVYYLRIMVNGKRYFQSLKTSQKPVAEARAKERIKLIEKEDFEALDKRKVKKGYAKIGDVIAAYQKAANARRLISGKPKEATVKEYVIQLRNLLRKGAGYQGDVDNLSSEVLSRKLIKDYIQAEIEACAGKNRLAASRARTTINATLRNARAMFSKWARDEYYETIKLPNLQPFLDAATTPVSKKKYERPPQSLIDKTVECGRSLKKDAPSQYVVFVLAHDVGMRAGEIMAMQKHWLVDLGENRYGIEIKDRPGEWDGPKSGVGRIVPIHKTTWKELQELSPASGHLIQGATDYEREKIVKRQFADWMRSIGWNRETYPKAAHELRKLFGCRCISEYPNPCVAQKRLGHKYLATTTDYYADYMDDDPALDPLM